MSYADFMAAIDSDEYSGAARTAKRSGEDIMADFAPIIEAQRGG